MVSLFLTFGSNSFNIISLIISHTQKEKKMKFYHKITFIEIQHDKTDRCAVHHLGVGTKTTQEIPKC